MDAAILTLYKLLTDANNPVWDRFLNNREMLNLAKYLVKCGVGIVEHRGIGTTMYQNCSECGKEHEITECIEREKFKEQLLIGSEYLDEETLMVVINILDCEPAADVVLAQHGYWEKQTDGSHYCSQCGRNATFNFEGAEILGVTCPYCGVIMNKGVNNG